MFTHRKVSLSGLAAAHGLEIRRDCEFSFVGKVPTRLAGRIVPCTERRHLAEALGADGIVGIVTTPELADAVPAQLGLATSERPQAATWAIHEDIARRPGLQWEDFPSRIDPAAVIHTGAHVAERNVAVGPGTVIMPGAVVCERTVIGANCLIGPGSVLGCDAFEVDTGRQPHRLLAQAGGVLLGDDVEITGHSTVVRATFGGFTELRAEVKLDCHVHVAHDCKVGERTRLAAGAILAGRVDLGADVLVGPNATISNGLAIGDKATVTIGAVVVRDVASGERVTGHFAVPHRTWLRFISPNK